ncbi:MAG: hypothetical protein IH905_10305 [Proteobacteria bacterium]|nr:hypothetical protein [Pseudomonadota bacterium]
MTGLPGGFARHQHHRANDRDQEDEGDSDGVRDADGVALAVQHAGPQSRIRHWGAMLTRFSALVCAT